MTHSISDTQHNNHLHYAECGYAESRVLFIVMLSVVMLNVVMLNVGRQIHSVAQDIL
jgi:hypothetical protein